MENKIEYIFNLFNLIYGIGNEKLEIHYGVDHESRIQIQQGSTGYFNQKKVYNFNNVVWREWKGIKIPFLFDESDRSDFYTIKENKIIINYDIIASSFFFLSGWHEYVNMSTDDLGRFPYKESIQYKLDVVDKPIVNYYFDILKTAIEKAYNTRLHVKLWGDFDFATCITHDIDKCRSAWLEGSFRELLKGRILIPVKLISKRLFQEDAWFNFEEILNIEKKYDVHSSFYFLSRKGRESGFKNADYDINNKKLRNVIRKILDNNSEIGIHGSFGTHTSLEKFMHDMEKLNFDIIGNRFHFLNFDITITPNILEQANIKYDTSLGFSEHFGFRNSFCLPFYLYDIENDRPTKVLEIPLNLMDVTLAYSKYMNLKSDEVMPKVEELIKEIRKFNGCFTFLWHNNLFSEYKFSGWKEVFIRLLEYCKREKSLFASGREIYSRYDENFSIGRNK